MSESSTVKSMYLNFFWFTGCHRNARSYPWLPRGFIVRFLGVDRGKGIFSVAMTTTAMGYIHAVCRWVTSNLAIIHQIKMASLFLFYLMFLARIRLDLNSQIYFFFFFSTSDTKRVIHVLLYATRKFPYSLHVGLKWSLILLYLSCYWSEYAKLICTYIQIMKLSCIFCWIMCWCIIFTLDAL